MSLPSVCRHGGREPQREDWTDNSIIQAAPASDTGWGDSGPISVFFVLGGLRTNWIDDLALSHQGLDSALCRSPIINSDI